MRKTAGIAFSLFCFTALASAQIPTSGNVFAGYSYYNTSLGAQRQSLNGWEASLEGKLFPVPFLGVVADFSTNYGSAKFLSPAAACAIGAVCTPVSASAHVDNFLLGPRVSASIGSYRLFAEGVFGFGHVNTNGFGSDTSFASGVGGGMDYKLFRLLAWRFQGDYIHTKLFNLPQNNVRLSTGIAVHF
jgi:hypothetical protein